MFKGIIEDIGTIIQVDYTKGQDRRLVIKPTNANFLSETKIGDSIGCSGICLSAVELDNECFSADVSDATLSVTSAAHWKEGTKINLELPLKMTDRLDGHFVQGHVDGVGNIISITNVNSSHNIEFHIPDALLKYMIRKGSIAIDGVSLTINSISNNILSVNIIPHTWKKTTFQYNKVNDNINIEVDMLAKHLERLYEHNIKV
ncbi:riboflavin synthase, alpha subunit [Ehrlichia chaffeensis str. Heartland]|nr:riboflavin synthase [Ehrlichia chaffeensis]AHX05911.1 riboflavin synthase, alpha subunit [Ehrlichia chaffeensis str. Jax]AHX03370.1 riboflavin synthase, alpha subunit [Ehrlichia chaffeensis str. Heartland]AHX06901.1 riboflavin synthase, alpha subunit [Ehrlichia chaffeensis str. Liberty]AHX07288.1 riboflavin synthase, alpha subunit [Ehrlichia chaffeensis str. Osceola]AHX08103.1 riboflavin synthase, alpha subunit [Ehrlichia chaffeensis str. Saint Vincent]